MNFLDRVFQIQIFLECIIQNLPTEVALLTLLENLDYSKFKNDNFTRPAAIDSHTMMVIIIYARMDNRFSSRAIEKLGKRDKFISAVLSNRKFPSHINRFIKNNPEAIENSCALYAIDTRTVGATTGALSSKYSDTIYIGKLKAVEYKI